MISFNGSSSDSFVAKEDTNFTALLKEFRENYPVQYWKDCCYFKEKDIEQISVHWLKFKPPGKEHYYGLAIMYFIVMVMGFTGNFTVIVLYFRRRSLRTPANTLIVNLAFSDLIMMCMIPIFLYNCYHRGPALGSIGCKFYGFLGGISGTVSICLLSATSFDRFHVIKYPLTRQPSFSRTKILAISCWIYGGIFSIIPAIDVGLGKYVPEGYLVSCSYEYLTDKAEVRNFILAFFVAAWVIPFCLILFSYLNILHVVLRGNSNMTNNNNSYKHIKSQKKIKQEIKVAIIVLFVIFVWFIAWTPYAVVSLLGIFGREDLITPFGSMVPALFCKSASCLDPYIYTLSNSRFKHELHKLFKQARKPTFRLYYVTASSCSRRDDVDSVIEETVMVDFSKYSARPQRFRLSRQVTPLQLPAVPSSWWARPSFNDECNLAKIRRLVRNIPKGSRSSQETE